MYYLKYLQMPCMYSKPNTTRNGMLMYYCLKSRFLFTEGEGHPWPLTRRRRLLAVARREIDALHVK